MDVRNVSVAPWLPALATHRMRLRALWIRNNFPLSSRIDARQRELIEQERLVKGMMS